MAKGAEIVKERISAPLVRRLLEVAEPGEISYGLVGITPGSNRSDKSVALAASPRNGDGPEVALTWKTSCMVRKSEECV